MKDGSLKIGTKGGPQVSVPIAEPENIEDVRTLSRGSEIVVLRCFTRGWRIENQERSGARDYVRENGGKLEEAELAKGAAKIVAEYDPTKVAERLGRPRAPKKVTLPAGVKSMTPDKLAELLAAQGVEVVMEEAEAVPA